MKIKADLEYLYMERFIRNREHGNIVWTTKYGNEIPINGMSDTHLNNTIAMLERQKEILDHIGDTDI